MLVSVIYLSLARSLSLSQTLSLARSLAHFLSFAQNFIALLSLWVTMADAAGISFPFDDPVLNNIVEALLSLKSGVRTTGGDALRNSLRLPPLLIPKRKRSRQIDLQGIRDAKRLQQQEEEAKKNAFSALVSYCNASGDCGRRAGPKRKKAISATWKRAGMDPVPERPKFVMREAGPLKLIIRKVKEKATCDKEEDDRNCKRKIDGAGLAEEDMSFTKKIKLSSSQPEPMSARFHPI